MVRRQGKHRAQHRAAPSRGARVFRVSAVVVTGAAVALALTAFGPHFLDRSSARADEKFVAAVHAEGRTVAPGATQNLVIEAAHKLCRSGDEDATAAERRANGLTTDEIEAVRQTFGDDSPSFMKVAKRTYCPLSR